jgi:hypothetical protein
MKRGRETRSQSRRSAAAGAQPTVSRFRPRCARKAFERSRGRCCRSGPYPVLSVNPAAVHAPVEVDRDADAYPLLEGHPDRRLLRDAGCAAPQGCRRIVGVRIGRLKDGWLDEHIASQKRDLSAKRYVYIWTDGIHLQARLEDEKQCILSADRREPEARKELVGLTDGDRESAQTSAICCST